MKTLRLVIVSLLIASSANADTLPFGCYVAYTNPTQCWEPSTITLDYIVSGSAVAYYGTAMAVMILEAKTHERDLGLCNSDYNTLAATTVQCVQQRDTANAAVIKLARYAKRLKKACGSACKKIR